MLESPVLTSIHIFESPTIISQVELVLVSFSWVCKTLTAVGLARLDFFLTVVCLNNDRNDEAICPSLSLLLRPFSETSLSNFRMIYHDDSQHLH